VSDALQMSVINESAPEEKQAATQFFSGPLTDNPQNHERHIIMLLGPGDEFIR